MIEKVLADLKKSYFIVVPLFLVSWYALGWVGEKILIAWIRKLTQKTESLIDDILVEAIHRPLLLFVVVSGLAVSYRYLIPENLAHALVPLFPALLKIISILAMAVFLGGMVLACVQT